MTDTIQGGPEKTERDTSYVDAMTGISVWGNFSWKKWTKISNFGSVVGILGHILWDSVEAPYFKISLFSLK